MSKALSFSALAGATTTTAAPGGTFLGLLAAGICVLTGWVIVRLLRPEKFFLRSVPGRQNQVNPLHVLAVFLLFYACGPLAMRVIALARGIQVHPDRALPMEVTIPGTIFGQLVLVAGALTVAATSFRHGLRRGLGLGLRHPFCDLGRGLIGYLAVLPLCCLALYVIRSLIPSEWVKIHPVLTFLPTASTGWVILALITAVVLAPVSEELLYRGLIQSMLRRYGLRPWPAILITSAVFAASHGRQLQDAPALFILAMALGYNYERTGRLVSPMVLHAAFNAGSIWTTLTAT